MSPLKPLADNIIVVRDPTAEVTTGGIVLPADAQEKTDYCTVVAVGIGYHLPDGAIRPLDVKVGDRVLIGKFTGKYTAHEGVDYLVVDEASILAVVE